jgi:hypothetical protein
MMLFPDEEKQSTPYTWGTRITEFQIGPIAWHMFEPVVLVGCIDYKFYGSPRHHQTGFAYAVSGYQNRLPPDSHEATVEVPPELVIFGRYMGGGTYAN